MKRRDLKKDRFPEEAHPSPIFCGKIKPTAVTKAVQSSSENLTQDISSPVVLAGNGRRSLEMGTALWSWWLRSGRALRWTPARFRAVETAPMSQEVGHRYPSALGTSTGSLFLACAEVGWMFRVNSCILWVRINKPICYHWNNKDWGLTASGKSSLWCFQDWHPELR